MNRGEQDISKAKGIVIRKVACAEKRSYVSKHFFSNLSSSVIYGQ